MVVVEVAVAVATVKYKTFYLIYNVNVHFSATAKANIVKSFLTIIIVCTQYRYQ